MVDKKRILILGYGRGGKDTLAEHLRDNYGYKFTSSSHFAAKKVIYNAVKVMLEYNSFDECYNDRHTWRDLWYNMIKAYNWHDRSRLAREMIEEGYDIYVGMRDMDELIDCKEKGLFDVIVWVDGVERTGYVEPESSCNITQDMADIIITNNGTQEEFHNKIDTLVEVITNDAWEVL